MRNDWLSRGRPARAPELGSGRDGSEFVAERALLAQAFARIEARKRTSDVVANHWSSLRHFRSFPDPTPIPCAAGWINATLDPEGNLFHCGQVARGERNNVIELGAALAFERLTRRGCSECWCARVVEENWAWGGRFDRMLSPRARTITQAAPTKHHLKVVG